jgi:hypothetical protein
MSIKTHLSLMANFMEKTKTQRFLKSKNLFL